MKKHTFNSNGRAERLAKNLCMKKGDVHLLIGCSRSHIHHADIGKRTLSSKYSARLLNLEYPIALHHISSQKTKTKSIVEQLPGCTVAQLKKVNANLKKLRFAFNSLERKRMSFLTNAEKLTRALHITQTMMSPDPSDQRCTAMFNAWKNLHMRQLSQTLKKYDTYNYNLIIIKKEQIELEIRSWEKLIEKE